MKVWESNNRDERIRELLEVDPIANIYQMGALDTSYQDLSRWFLAGDNLVEGIMLLYTGLSAPALFPVGSRPAISAILNHARNQLPRRLIVNLSENNAALVFEQFTVESLHTVVRLEVSRRSFHRHWSDREVVKLGHMDTADLISLYKYYPDNFFDPYQLSTGHYFGVREDGMLVAAAGAHLVAQSSQVAAIGNVVTHPRFRGRGLGRTCTSHLLNNLFEKVERASLDVLATAERSIAMFESLGFRRHSRHLEGFIVT